MSRASYVSESTRGHDLMAVYTEVPPGELARFVASYGLGRLLDYKGITQGVENTNYRVDTEKGRFFLTLYEKRVAVGDLPFFLGLMEHLADHGLNCPVPVHNSAGVVLGELAGRPAAIVTWLEGAWPKSQSVAQCAALGAALAELHLDGADFKLTRANALGISGWRPLFEKFAAHCDRIAPKLDVAIGDELKFVEALWPHDLPQGVIHADLFPDNTFFIGDKLSAIFDFYFACNDSLAFDLAICINAWCFDDTHTFSAEKSRALVQSYQQVRPLTGAEITALPLLTRGAALRFLLTRAHDWIHTPPNALVQRKDPLEYMQKLRFHQSVRDGGAYGLED